VRLPALWNVYSVKSLLLLFLWGEAYSFGDQLFILRCQKRSNLRLIQVKNQGFKYLARKNLIICIYYRNDFYRIGHKEVYFPKAGCDED